MVSTIDITPQPSVSVVVVARNEEQYIRDCLESILSQDYENMQEILVYDGMSEDGTRGVVAEFEKRCAKIALRDNPERIQTFALNRGMEAARGDVIVRIDVHAIYAPDYVRQCVHHLVQTGAGSVGGPAVPCTHDSYVARAIGFAHESRFGIGVARFRQSSYEGYVDSVWPGAFWKSVFNEVGRFREDLSRSEDTDWNARLRARGYRVFLTPEIRAYYFPRTKLRGLAKQYFANGSGISQTLFANWRAVRLRHVLPLLFLLSLLACAFASFLTPFGIAAFAGIVGCYMVSCLLFSAGVACRNGLQYLAVMPLVFWTIHFAYGLGSLWGLLKFGVLERWDR